MLGMQSWLADTSAGGGAGFADNIVFDGTSLLASRFTAVTLGLADTEAKLVAMDDARAACGGVPFSCYPFQWDFLWLERYRRIDAMTIQTIISAFVAILLLTFLFLRPREGVIVASIVGMCPFCVFMLTV